MEPDVSEDEETLVKFLLLTCDGQQKAGPSRSDHGKDMEHSAINCSPKPGVEQRRLARFGMSHQLLTHGHA